MTTNENKQAEPVAWADEIIDDLQGQFDTDGITHEDSGDALIYLSQAISAVQDAAKRHPAPAVAQEPVHFRAVLCTEQQKQAVGVVPKVVGFVDKKAAEQFILEKRDFQGWRYNLEPLYTEAPSVAVNEVKNETDS